MKMKYAAQILSHNDMFVIHTHALTPVNLVLPKAAIKTAQFGEKINSILDNVNANQ